MADNDLTKISTALLPLADIATIMNAQYGFVTESGSANDVKNVGGIASERIAIAASTEDRETVKNSQELGGIVAGNYMLKTEGAEISSTNALIKQNYSSDIRDLKDELYQLRMELAKKGVVQGYKPYAGYYDMFINGKEENVEEAIASAVADSISKDSIVVGAEKFDLFDVNDYIALYFTEEKCYHVCQVKAKNIDGVTVLFTPSTSFDIKAGIVDVYKSVGTVDNGAYNFYEKSQDLMDSVEMYTTLNDDTYRVRKQITAAHTGYAYNFRIPEAQRGFLTKLSLQIKTYGNPGALMCYIINEDDIENFDNPAQAEANGIILAKSQPLTQSSDLGERMATFNFWNGSSYPLLNQMDEADKRVRYVFIVEALSADLANYYDVVFLQSATAGDLQVNSTTFNYARQDTGAVTDALTTDSAINAFDIYYSVVTRGVIDEGITPHREAIYTAKFDTDENIQLSDAKLALRIAREGYYTTSNLLDTAYVEGNSVPVEKQAGLADYYDMSQIAGCGLKANDEDVIVGNFIRRISSQNSSSIVIKDGVYLKPKSPVYRAGYKVFLKAWNKTLNKDTGRFEINDYARIELPLSAVLADKHKTSEKISDRLIYEADNIVGVEATRYFNAFELQIYWHTEYGAYYDSAQYKADFVGRIHDLSLSLGRGI